MELSCEPATVPNFCEWCFAVGTRRCGRCQLAYYCCTDHQEQHWSLHMKVCKKSLPPIEPIPVLDTNILNTISPSTSQSVSSYGDWSQNTLPTNEDFNSIINPLNAYKSSSFNINPAEIVDLNFPEAEIFSSISSELFSSDNNLWDLINACNTQSISSYNMPNAVDPTNHITGTCELPPPPPPPPPPPSAPINEPKVSLNDMCKDVIEDLNQFGICVLDKFVGETYGNLILQEVKNLYRKGIFKQGELVKQNPHQANQHIRSDVTTWVDGSEPDCKYIANLMKKLDAVMLKCSQMPNNQLLSKYKLQKRTKAMIACYPGDGTHYVKHVDNPNKDGRCITCIYYLNKNWDVKRDGGLLRLFPAAYDSQIANVEPIFDRMILFWSDKRNPHEVLPSFATRFAITVWYLDVDERSQALKKFQEMNLR